MSHRDATPSDFEGKTIAKADVSAANIWRFLFSDGTRIAVETETDAMVICDECAEISHDGPARIVIEGSLPEKYVSREDAGKAVIADMDVPDDPNSEEGFHVQLRSWSERSQHPVIESLIGKRIRVTVEVLD